MKKIIAAVAVGFFAVVAVSAQELATEDQKVFYTLGASLGENVSQFHLTPEEFKFVLMGLNDFQKGSGFKVDYSLYKEKLGDYAEKRMTASAEIEKNKAKTYLAKAEKEKGAVTTESGVIYIELKKGEGEFPKPSSSVKVNYKGSFVDGKIFDKNEANTPAVFQLEDVVSCWGEGIQKMKKGGKAKFICPSDTAYGDVGRPPVIPGGAVLVFEVELVDIVAS